MQLSIRGTIPFLLLVLMPMVCLAQTVKGGAKQTVQADPPFSGTVFIDPDIITSSDPTTFQSVSYVGQGSRTMFDRRVNNWITVNAYLFNASFDDGLTAEIQVNPEFGSSDAALAEAQKYGSVIGQLPTVLRTDVETVWIHKGTEPFGGGNYNLLIHIGQGDRYAARGFLEEVFVHEASHTSLDPYHASAPGWLAAQAADGEFISTYARDFPDREDIAESFLPYWAVRYRSDRISESLANTILQTIPNRIAYFDSLSLKPQFLTHDTGPLQVSITNEGNIGFLTWHRRRGDGFVYNGDNYLFEGGLMVGVNVNQVSDCIRGENGVEQDHDFVPVSILQILSPGALATEEGHIIFVDSLAADPIGLGIEQVTFADTASGDNNFVIFTYLITNLNDSPVTGLHVGLFFDWDVINYDVNSARYDAGRKMGYTQDQGFGPTAFAGTKLLNRYTGVSYRSISNPDELYDGFTDTEKWDFLSGGIQTQTLNDMDVSTLLSVGPFDIGPDSSVMVGFAVIGANSLKDLESAADVAQVIWDTYFEEVAAVDNTVVPEVFALHQNYPNPFNPVTTITYSLPKSGIVNLSIYNVVGQLVETLVNEQKNVGYHSIVWDASSVSSGVYFYRIEAGEYTETKKCLILK